MGHGTGRKETFVRAIPGGRPLPQ